MRRRILRHAALFNVGDTLGSLYVVRYGQFKLCGFDPTGDEVVSRFCMPGELLGFDAIAVGQHHFRAIALEDSEVCAVPYARVDELISVAPQFRDHFLSALSFDAIEQYERSAILVNNHSDQRFGHFLLSLGDRYALLGYSARSFRLSMSRRDIASYLGVTVESISRSIKRFNANKWVQVTHRDVEIMERLILEDLAENWAMPNPILPNSR